MTLRNASLVTPVAEPEILHVNCPAEVFIDVRLKTRPPNIHVDRPGRGSTSVPLSCFRLRIMYSMTTAKCGICWGHMPTTLRIIWQANQRVGTHYAGKSQDRAGLEGRVNLVSPHTGKGADLLRATTSVFSRVERLALEGSGLDLAERLADAGVR